MRILQKHPWAAAALGFLSIYIVWALPAIFVFNWSEWFSWAYKYGDHLVLPTFNAIAFYLLAKNKGKIPRWSVGVAVLCGLLLVFFEPDASAFREAGEVDLGARLYHTVFIFLEFSFIVFMLLLYPFVPRTYAPLWGRLRLKSCFGIANVTLLYMLIGLFLWFTQGADAWFHDFSLAENIAPGTIVGVTYIFLLLDRRFRITGRVKRYLLKRILLKSADSEAD